MNRTDFAVDEYGDLLLTASEDAGAKRGRPQEIEDATLGRAFDELKFVLEQNWGDLGLRLMRARTLADIRLAFNEDVNPRSSRLEPFRYSRTRQTTGREVRILQKQCNEIQSRVRENSLSFRHALNLCESASQAWLAEQNMQRRGEIESARRALTRRFEEAQLTLRDSQGQLESLCEELKECEAHFSQSEILDFIRSGRREFTPLVIASAMAGLPFVSARVSSERVSAIRPGATHGHSYLLFKAIHTNFAESIHDVSQAIEKMREYLIDSRRNKLAYIRELRKNWYFLEIAILSAVRSGAAMRASLPYQIFAAYSNSVGLQKPGDAVLAEAQRILIHGEMPEREDLPNWD